MAGKVTRILPSQGLNRDKYDRRARIAVLCGRVRGDARQRCRGLSTVLPSPSAPRAAWMVEGHAWHGLPAQLGKAVPVKQAIRHRTRGDKAERHRLYSLPKRNRWDEDPFLHRQMRKPWQGDRSHVTNRIVADAGTYTTKVRHGRAWAHLQSMERGQRIALPLKGSHLPIGTLRLLLQPNGQVEIHHAVDEDAVCCTRPCGEAAVGVDKGYTEAYADSDGARHGQEAGGLLAAESDHGKDKGRRRNHLKAVHDKHVEKGNTRKAGNYQEAQPGTP